MPFPRTLFSLLWFSISSTCVADTLEFEQLLQLSLSDLLKKTVTVSSKTPVAQNNSVDVVTVITRQQIEAFGYRTLDDALVSEIGFYKNYDRNYMAVNSRGFSPRGNTMSRILLLHNGERLSEAFYGTLTLGQAFPVDMSSVERIEISKGPGSSIWGSEAVFAVINVVTSAKQNGTPRAVISAGDRHTGAAYLESLHQSGSGAQLLAAVSRYTSAGDTRIDLDTIPDYYYDDFTARDRDGESSEKALLEFNYQSFKASWIYSDRRKEVPVASYQSLPNGDTFTIDRFWQLAASYDSALNNSTDWHSDFTYNEYTYRGDYGYDYGIAYVPYDPFFTTYKDDLNSARWAVESNLLQRWSNSWQTLIGVEYQQFGPMTLVGYDRKPYTQYLDERYYRYGYSFYAESRHQLDDRWQLNWGLRGDHINTIETDEFSPRIGLRYQQGRHSWHLNYGEAFLAPNITQQQYDSGNDAANPDLQSEQLESWEFSWLHQLDDNTQSRWQLYHYTLKDLQIRVLNNEGNNQYQNIGEVESTGLEWKLTHQTRDGVLMYVGLMTGKTEDQDGSWWVNTPRAMANAGVSLPLTSQWQAAIDTQWLGERRTDEYAWQFDGIDTYSKIRTGAGELDAQWTGNLILTWGKHLPDTTVSVGIYNLANSTNYNPAWPQHAQNRIPLPARSTLVKIDHRFD